MLASGYGSDVMQIEVLIDGPVDEHYLGALRELCGERVAVFLHHNTVGQARNLNSAIARAKGKFLHILHHDDLVLPGFYEAIEQGFAANESIGACFTRHAVIDEEGHWQELSHLEQRTAGIVSDWLPRLAVYCRLQTPSIAVRRNVYEALGGFRDDLVFALDWEMWVRIARHYNFWFDPRILALYRVTGAGVSGSMRCSAEDMRDVAKAIGIMGDYLPEAIREHSQRAALDAHAGLAITMARKMYIQNNPTAARNQLRAALEMSWSRNTLLSAARVELGQLRRRINNLRRRNPEAIGDSV